MQGAAEAPGAQRAYQVAPDWLGKLSALQELNLACEGLTGLGMGPLARNMDFIKRRVEEIGDTLDDQRCKDLKSDLQQVYRESTTGDTDIRGAIKDYLTEVVDDPSKECNGTICLSGSHRLVLAVPQI